MKIIGISGLARSGKDLFATVAADILKERGLRVARHALATELKSDLKDLIFDKALISAFTENTKEKNIIRPLLVAYGDMMRKLTHGKYWTQKVEDRINYLASVSNEIDFDIITDIRYDSYPEDECYWVQNKMMGKLIHITRFKLGPAPSKRHVTTATPVKIYDAAPNDHEQFNNPKVKARADYAFEWVDVSDECPTAESLRNSPYIIDHVKTALKSIGVIT
jgi:hypothetical protein